MFLRRKKGDFYDTPVVLPFLSRETRFPRYFLPNPSKTVKLGKELSGQAFDLTGSVSFGRMLRRSATGTFYFDDLRRTGRPGANPSGESRD